MRRSGPRLLGRRRGPPAAGGSQHGRSGTRELARGAPPARDLEGAAEGTQAAPRRIAPIPSRPAGQLHEGVCNIASRAQVLRAPPQRDCGILDIAMTCTASDRQAGSLVWMGSLHPKSGCLALLQLLYPHCGAERDLQMT